MHQNSSCQAVFNPFQKGARGPKSNNLGYGLSAGNHGYTTPSPTGGNWAQREGACVNPTAILLDRQTLEEIKE